MPKVKKQLQRQKAEEKSTKTSIAPKEKKKMEINESKCLTDSEYDDLFDSVLHNLEHDIPKVALNVDEDFDALANIALPGGQAEDVQIVPGEYPLQPLEDEEMFEDALYNSIVEVTTPKANDKAVYNEKQKFSPPKLKKKRLRLGKKNPTSKKQLQFNKITNLKKGISLENLKMENYQQQDNSQSKRRKSQKQYLISLQQKLRNLGTYVECCVCKKWRFLESVKDPVCIPEHWECSMSKDNTINSCDVPEDKWSDEIEEKSIFNEYTAGSIVWAKVDGYPWWPAMVDDDPDIGDFWWENDSNEAILYHVIFFDEKVSRSWVNKNLIYPFKESTKNWRMAMCSRKNYASMIDSAKIQALEALKLTIKERLDKFGFVARYTGKWYFHYSSDEEDLRPKRKKHNRPTAKKHLMSEEKNTSGDNFLSQKLLESADAIMNVLDEDSSTDTDFIPPSQISKIKRTKKEHSRKKMTMKTEEKKFKQNEKSLDKIKAVKRKPTFKSKTLKNETNKAFENCSNDEEGNPTVINSQRLLQKADELMNAIDEDTLVESDGDELPKKKKNLQIQTTRPVKKDLPVTKTSFLNKKNQSKFIPSSSNKEGKSISSYKPKSTTSQAVNKMEKQVRQKQKFQVKQKTDNVGDKKENQCKHTKNMDKDEPNKSSQVVNNILDISSQMNCAETKTEMKKKLIQSKKICIKKQGTEENANVKQTASFTVKSKQNLNTVSRTVAIPKDESNLESNLHSNEKCNDTSQEATINNLQIVPSLKTPTETSESTFKNQFTTDPLNTEAEERSSSPLFESDFTYPNEQDKLNSEEVFFNIEE